MGIKHQLAAKKRLAKFTKEQISKRMRKIAKIRHANMSPTEKKEMAQKMVDGRDNNRYNEK